MAGGGLIGLATLARLVGWLRQPTIRLESVGGRLIKVVKTCRLTSILKNVDVSNDKNSGA